MFFLHRISFWNDKKKRKEKRDSALNALIFLNSLFSGECNKYEKKNNLKKKGKQ